jgi:hypothetical protein
MAHGDAWEGKWRGNWRMEWVASTLHTTSEHGVSSITAITTTDAHTSAASSRMNWRPRRFKWTRPFRRKTKSGFCACAIIFQTQSTLYVDLPQLADANNKRKVKQTLHRPGLTTRVPEGWWVPKFVAHRHMKTVNLSTLRTCHLYRQEKYLYSFLSKAESTPGL